MKNIIFCISWTLFIGGAVTLTGCEFFGKEEVVPQEREISCAPVGNPSTQTNNTRYWFGKKGKAVQERGGTTTAVAKYFAKADSTGNAVAFSDSLSTRVFFDSLENTLELILDAPWCEVDKLTLFGDSTDRVWVKPTSGEVAAVKVYSDLRNVLYWQFPEGSLSTCDSGLECAIWRIDLN